MCRVAAIKTQLRWRQVFVLLSSGAKAHHLRQQPAWPGVAVTPARRKVSGARPLCFWQCAVWCGGPLVGGSERIAAQNVLFLACRQYAERRI